MARLVDYFTSKYATTSCGELTKSFPISSFAMPNRIEHCMNIIAFVASATAQLLSDVDETFRDAEKEMYFAQRERQSWLA
jgi:hypothetical protein